MVFVKNAPKEVIANLPTGLPIENHLAVKTKDLNENLKIGEGSITKNQRGFLEREDSHPKTEDRNQDHPNTQVEIQAIRPDQVDVKKDFQANLPIREIRRIPQEILLKKKEEIPGSTKEPPHPQAEDFPKVLNTIPISLPAKTILSKEVDQQKRKIIFKKRRRVIRGAERPTERCNNSKSNPC